jgi:hypothetical protein
MKKVYSSPKRLKWFHWVLIVVQTLSAAGALWAAFYFANDPEAKKPGQGFLLAGMLSVIWYQSAFAMLRKRMIFQYDETGVGQMENSRCLIDSVIPYSDISGATIVSEGCLRLKFRVPVQPTTIPLRVFTVYRSQPMPTISEMEFSANEDDLSSFETFLSSRGVSVVKDPIPDDDPRKQMGTLIVGIILVMLLIGGGIWMASQASHH